MQLEDMGIMIQLSSVKELDPPNLEEGINDDGIVDGYLVETHYCALLGLKEANGYLRVCGDNDFTDVEIRIPFKQLEALGWRKV